MKINRISNVITLFLAVVTVIGVFTFAHVCKSMGRIEGPCIKTRTWAVVAAIVLGVFSLINFLVTQKVFQRVLSVLRIAAGILLILIPVSIAPVCRVRTMHCNAYTKPFLILIGITSLVVIIGSNLLEYAKEKGVAQDALS